jgi:hypothetical protein
VLGVIETAHVSLAVAISPQIDGSLLEDVAVNRRFFKVEYLVFGLSFEACGLGLDGAAQDFACGKTRRRVWAAEYEVAPNAECASND